ncbi:cytochrome c3 family protein [Candidatus Magnetominusculus xianensis]|uniref:Cytochrome c7-like domain-containing protein n=1 Tax=Candidatus Magnetominusculus xianensis TaxID=1748249 RepID=A0ABR5SMB0_9BACT|nr:cytochrome c3 family protein [Candidatus Magnetominusculus xianensis]KWT91816.1 hypothetical protein ASN18_0718 [Candidatus Magnetominusculus xianensis]MBF0403872.1 hypothetical protein [Nitrospirota bacterium]
MKEKLFATVILAVIMFYVLPGLAAAETDIPKLTTTKPPFTEGIFPCSSCHASMPPNKEKRVLAFHPDIQLKHGGNWCLDCHDSANRDMLHLANGDLIPFDKVYQMCGQCHGNIYRDWKTGIHGKRTGYWNGDKTYYLCVNCHNPHSPKFKPIKPLPVPAKPLEIMKVKSTVPVVIEEKKLYIPEYDKANDKANEKANEKDKSSHK